ncbi:MAG TPA: tetratricopeptide repeat protein [Casimicrobiaceae bacterium]|nr:tetratricopeptide repeat protein [Casimicrobiaceae bacterium]
MSRPDIDWFQRGREHQWGGRPVDAMLCFRRAVAAAPAHGDARFHLGEVQWALGLTDAAKSSWAEVVRMSPKHLAGRLALAEACLNTGDAAGAKAAALQALECSPDDARARTFLLVAGAALGDPGIDWSAISAAVRAKPAMLDAPARARLIAEALDRTDGAPGFDAFVDTLAGMLERAPLELLASIADACARRGAEQASHAASIFAEARRRDVAPRSAEAWRRLALAASVAGDAEAAREFATRYGRDCTFIHAPTLPVLWPRRTAGNELRVALLVGPSLDATMRDAFRALAGPGIEVTLVVAGTQEEAAAMTPQLPFLPKALVAVGARPNPASARTLLVRDPDLLIDAAGLACDVGAWIAQRAGRRIVTLADLEPPLVDERVERSDAALASLIASLPRRAETASTATALSERFSVGLRAQQAGDAEAASGSYAAVLAEQPGFAPALQFRARLAWDAGEFEAAGRDLAAAMAAAPQHAELVIDASRLAVERDAAHVAAAIVRKGLERIPAHPGLMAALGHALLKLGDGAAAVEVFQHAMALDPLDAELHYNLGVAHQLVGNGEAAARSYQHALAFDPSLVEADFNLGVLFQQENRFPSALAAYQRVLEQDPTRAAAWKNIGEMLHASGRMDDWATSHRRFEERCPDSLLLAVQSLEFYQLQGDFAAVERVLDGLRLERYRADDDNTLVDALEELLYLLLFFDIDAGTIHRFARTYDTAAKHVYGLPRRDRPARRPGRLRIGYLSADLRDHVMGKMIWEAVSRHDRSRFDVYFYAMNLRRDAWTGRFEGIATAFRDVSALTDRAAAHAIGEDDLDILVDLQTHTRHARPGILALKPARVQITHVASAGTLGLSTIDWKLTDAYADLPEAQETQIEPLLAMAGCVYPWRAVAPAESKLYTRAALRIPDDAVVVGAFVTPLKLSRRCLTLWKEFADRVPHALFAISPLRPDFREVTMKIFAAAGIGEARVIAIPPGHDDASSQARYRLVDLVLDPLPFGNVNGTLEPLAMGVPVVTLVGKRHGERTGLSILANLGVTSTVAQSGREYVDIAEQLATDPAFMREVRGAIAARLPGSVLADVAAHARNLEAAYVVALARSAPDVLASAGISMPALS